MSDFKSVFEQKLREIFDGKNENSVITNQNKRDGWLQRLLLIESQGPQINDDYNLRKRFEVLRVGNVDRLIKKRKNLNDEFGFVISFEEVHGALVTAHAAVGHGGEKKTFLEAKKNGPTSL